MASTPHLHNLLEEIIQWCSESDFPYQVYISWTDTQLQALVSYFSQVDVDSTFSLRMYRKLRLNEAWQDKDLFKPQICTRATQLVVSFLQDLGDLFQVPKLPQQSHSLSNIDNTLNNNQLVAGFITFLLQLLHPDSSFLASYAFPVVRTCVVKELKFFVRILGDTPFQPTDHDQVQSILAEFEQVANGAGSLVHSLIFVPDVAVKTMNEAISALLEQVEQLKANIVKFLDLFPDIVDLVPTTNYDVESLYIVASLLHDLKNLVYRDDNPLAEVKDQIRTLQKYLTLCQSLLKEPQHTETEDLNQELMVPVIGLANDAEYLINSFLVGDVPLWYLANRLTHHISKLKLIEGRLQQTKKDCSIDVAKFACKLSQQHTNKGFGVDDIVVGFEENEAIIRDELVGGTEHLQCILIFGMSGLGKTTMARKLYNQQYVKYRFDKKSWCVASQAYQKKSLLIGMLINLQNEFDESMMLRMDEDSLALKTYQTLKDRRYLIVVDDVWDSYLWEDLQWIFPNDGNGSRILFTSRHKHVAPPGSFIHVLPLLSENQCWELLKKKVFHNNTCPPYLQETGKNIAKKCYGLPLVVVLIAGILSTLDMEESAWESVDRNLDSYMLLDENKSVMQILELSYKHLPPHLKPCFLYFGSRLVSDREFRSKELKQFWVAQGFISLEEEEEKGTERLTEEYLMELIDRSLVIVFERGSSGGVKRCGIHDLLHDLCLRLADKYHFLKHVDCDSSIWYHKSNNLHLVTNLSHQSSCHRLVPYGPFVRSFFLHRGTASLSVVNMKSLRYLHSCSNLRSNGIFGIELLLHLRQLRLSHMVPSIDCLVNLEFLTVGGKACISSKILQMVKLRYLVGDLLYFHKSCNLSRSNSLEYLGIVHIYRQEDVEILKYSPRLHTLKFVYYPSDGGYEGLDLNFLTQLESLALCIVCGLPKVIIALPASIKKLKLTSLYLSSDVLEIIGKLPNLEVLKLHHIVFEKDRWDTRDGEFEQLRFLLLFKPHNLTHWNISSNEHFPKLHRLVLIGCSNLIEIPRAIGEINTLESIAVYGGREEMVESAKQIQSQQEEWGNPDFSVSIDSSIEGNITWWLNNCLKARKFFHRRQHV